jgi:hypothetical protein
MAIINLIGCIGLWLIINSIPFINRWLSKIIDSHDEPSTIGYYRRHCRRKNSPSNSELCKPCFNTVISANEMTYHAKFLSSHIHFSDLHAVTLQYIVCDVSKQPRWPALCDITYQLKLFQPHSVPLKWSPSGLISTKQ